MRVRGEHVGRRRSLDSLQREVYWTITGGRKCDLEWVLAGIYAALAADLSPIKLNVVVLKENEAEISDLIDFCREKGLIMQLVELLDLCHQGISGDIDAIERRLAAQAERVRVRKMHRRKKYFLYGAEVVRPMDNAPVLRQLHTPAGDLGREDQALLAAQRQPCRDRHLRL